MDGRGTVRQNLGMFVFRLDGLADAKAVTGGPEAPAVGVGTDRPGPVADTNTTAGKGEGLAIVGVGEDGVDTIGGLAIVGEATDLPGPEACFGIIGERFATPVGDAAVDIAGEFVPVAGVFGDTAAKDGDGLAVGVTAVVVGPAGEELSLKPRKIGPFSMLTCCLCE